MDALLRHDLDVIARGLGLDAVRLEQEVERAHRTVLLLKLRLPRPRTPADARLRSGA